MLSINKYAGSNCFKTNNIKRKTKLLSRPGQKPVKTGRLLLALRKLIDLMKFLTFLIMKKYYKNPVSLLIFGYKL